MLVLGKLADRTGYIWEELRSVTSLEVISSYLKRIGMVTRKNLGEPRYFQIAVTNFRPISLKSVVCEQMEHVIAGCLKEVWDKNDCLYEGQLVFRPGYSCESQVITVCQDIVKLVEEGVGIDAIIIYFSKAFDLVPHDRLLTKLSVSGVDWRAVVWVQEFLVGRTQRVRVGGQLSKEVRVTSGVPQGSVLGLLLFLVYVNDIWRNIDSCSRLR